MIPLRVAAAIGAGLLVSTALSPAGAQERALDAAATAPSGTAGRLVIADLPRMPGGPVCVKDRDWIVVEAEQFIARTTARAEELSRKVVELELAVERDPAAGRTAETTRGELRDTMRRVRDAQGYREEARRLTTRDCLVREGQGVDLAPGMASVSGAATAQAPQAAEPAIDVRLTQTTPCRPGEECEITLVSETRRPAQDDRRVAVLVDLPAGAGSFLRSSQAWNCYAMTGGAVCLAKLADLQPGSPAVSALTWRLQGGATAAEARACARTPKITADGRPSTDPDRMRVLQAVLTDYGYRGGAIDGKIDGSRVVLASAAPDFGIERNSDDDHIAAALLGSMVSRVGVTTGPCLQLALAPAATVTDAPVAAAIAPIGAAIGAAGAAALAIPPRAPDATAARSEEIAEPPAAKPPVPARPATASVAPQAPSELGQARVPAARPAKPVKTVKTRPPKPVATARAVEEDEEDVRPVVLVKPKKRRVIVESEEGPVVVAPARPRLVAPPISIGIGLGRRGGIGFGF